MMTNEYKATLLKEFTIAPLYARNHTEAYYMIKYKTKQINDEIARCATQIKSITMIRSGVSAFSRIM